MRRGRGCRDLPVRRAARTGDADGAEAIHQNTRLACLVIKAKLPFDEFIAELLHSCADRLEAPGERRNKNSGKTHRQFHPRLRSFDSRRPGGKDL